MIKLIKCFRNKNTWEKTGKNESRHSVKKKTSKKRHIFMLTSFLFLLPPFLHPSKGHTQTYGDTGERRGNYKSVLENHSI